MLEKISSARELRREFDHGSFARGMAYFRKGRVLDSKLDEHRDHDVITGWVRGSGNEPYEVHVLVEKSSGGLSVDGDCSCPVGYNCKHVVSVLLDLLDNRPQPAFGRGTAPLDGEELRDLALEHWLQRLEKAVSPGSVALYPSWESNRLIYVLKPGEPLLDAGAFVVEPVICRQLRKGGYGKPTPFSVDRAWQPHPPAYLLPEDADILRQLAPEPFAYQTGRLKLEGKSGAAVLERLIETGRCHWLVKDSPALAAGAARQAAVGWELADDGRQRLVFRTEPPAVFVAPTAPPWYIDVDRGSCGPVETRFAPALAGALATAPPVDPAQVRAVERLLQKTLPGISVPPPQSVQIEDVEPEPTPCLTLWQETVGQDLGHPLFHTSRMLPYTMARLGFDYGGHLVERGNADAAPLIRDGAGLVRIRRDSQAEERAHEQLLRVGLVPLSEVMYGVSSEHAGSFVADQGSAEVSFWLSFQQDVLPELTKAGWRVDIEESFPYPLVQPDEWYGDLDEGRDSGWFDLELGVVVDGRRVSLLPVLAHWLHIVADERELEQLRELPCEASMSIKLDDGAFLSLPAGRIRTILDNLLELYDREVRLTDGRLHLPVLRAAQLGELARAGDTAAGWRWLGGERLRELGERLRNFQGIAAAQTPQGFKATLRHYQREGLGWLNFLREYGLGGVLADDMGLGKTVQTLAHLQAEKQSGRMVRPSLVVAPTSLMVNWRMEAQRFAPGLRVLTLHGPDRRRRFEDLNKHDLILTTYALLSRDHEVLCSAEYYMLILDEAQNIKNPRAKATQTVQQLSARHRLCLTGTPMENHLGELWSLFHFLQPGLLGDQRQFRRLFRTPIERHGDGDRRAILSRRLAPFMLRRTKDEVAKELPPKTEIQREVELQGAQRDLYESIRVAMHEKVRKAIAQQGMERSHILILDALLKLRQACCDPRLVKLERAREVKESVKLHLLMDLLPEMVEEGRRILVFSQFTTMLSLIEEELQRASLPYVKLTGRTRDRALPIQRFQTGEVPLFLISLKAGGTGLNLTAADTVVHYDPWWNPAVENQATDRAHRLGQDRPVFVYRLMTTGTVEEKIIALQARKRELAQALLSEGGAAASRLSLKDLDALFQPLADIA